MFLFRRFFLSARNILYLAFANFLPSMTYTYNVMIYVLHRSYRLILFVENSTLFINKTDDIHLTKMATTLFIKL